jgi:hypothetical protein
VNSKYVEVEGSKAPETSVSYYNTILGHNAENVDLNLYSSSTYFTLKLEAASPFETLVSYHNTRRHNLKTET